MFATKFSIKVFLERGTIIAISSSFLHSQTSQWFWLWDEKIVGVCLTIVQAHHQCQNLFLMSSKPMKSMRMTKAKYEVHKHMFLWTEQKKSFPHQSALERSNQSSWNTKYKFYETAALFDISIWDIDCRYIHTFEKYRYRYRYR